MDALCNMFIVIETIVNIEHEDIFQRSYVFQITYSCLSDT